MPYSKVKISRVKVKELLVWQISGFLGDFWYISDNQTAFMIQIAERGGWHDIILTTMSHCDQPIAFCNHFYAPKLCFYTFLTFLVDMCLKKWYLLLGNWIYLSHTMGHGSMEVIFAKLYQYIEEMGQFCDTKVMFIPSCRIILAIKVGIWLGPLF